MTTPKRPLVLCVDDDPEILALVERCIARLPVEVRTTAHPSEVLVTIAREPVAVLVSDYDMPEMTGAQLAGQVKRLRPETVRILLTGQRSLETAIDGINEGEIFRFLSKPFDPGQLRAAVTDALARHAELVALTVDRSRHERRELLRASLEEEYPGISRVALDDHRVYHVSDANRTLIAGIMARLPHHK